MSLELFTDIGVIYFQRFSENNLKIKDKFKRDSVIKAMDIADQQINMLMKYCDKNSKNLWIASSRARKRKDILQQLIFKYLYETIFKIFEFKPKNYKSNQQCS